MKGKKELIRYVWYGKCKHSEFYYLNLVERYFYTFKTIICILLNKHKSTSYDDDYVDMVTSFDSSRDYWGDYSWEEICVGYGVFKNWYYDIYSNGS